MGRLASFKDSENRLTVERLRCTCLLRFSPCYKYGCGELRGVTQRSRNAFEPQLAYNVKTLGEEAELEAQTFSLAQTPIGSTNVEFSTNPAFLPNVCYTLPFFVSENIF